MANTTSLAGVATRSPRDPKGNPQLELAGRDYLFEWLAHLPFRPARTTAARDGRRTLGNTGRLSTWSSTTRGPRR